jgi:hypothetical protein
MAQILKELARLHGFRTHALAQVPDLVRAVRAQGTMLMTVCNFNPDPKSKHITTLADCNRWLRSARMAGYKGPAVLLSNVPIGHAIGLGDRHSGDGVWNLVALDEQLPRKPAVGSKNANSPTYSGNQMRLLWFASIMGELRRQAPNARIVIADARDIFFQESPFRSSQELFSGANSCKVLAAHDCKGAAVNDRYFQLWGGKCLPNSDLRLIGQRPPINGGFISGYPAQLEAVYLKVQMAARMNIYIITP